MITLIQPYYTFREKYKDAILVFRVGDTYETFNKDAEIPGDRMGISVMERDKNTEVKRGPAFPFIH